MLDQVDWWHRHLAEGDQAVAAQPSAHGGKEGAAVMPNTTPRKWAWYHVALHIVGAVLAAGAIVSLVLMIIYPHHPVPRSLAVASTCLAGIVITGTAVHRAVYEVGQALRARPDIEGSLRHARNEGYVAGAADRLNGAARVVQLPPSRN